MKNTQLEAVLKSESNADELHELAELELALVGGGSGDIIYH